MVCSRAAQGPLRCNRPVAAPDGASHCGAQTCGSNKVRTTSLVRRGCNSPYLSELEIARTPMLARAMKLLFWQLLRSRTWRSCLMDPGKGDAANDSVVRTRAARQLGVPGFVPPYRPFVPEPSRPVRSPLPCAAAFGQAVSTASIAIRAEARCRHPHPVIGRASVRIPFGNRHTGCGITEPRNATHE